MTTCATLTGRAGGLGHLKDGAIATVSTATARKLLGSPPAVILEALGSALKFDMAAGANGRVWVHAESVPTVIMVVNALTNSERLTDAQVRTMGSAVNHYLHPSRCCNVSNHCKLLP